MKLLIAIVNNDDSTNVVNGLTKKGFQVTKLATTGGFLLAGNTTFLIGVDESRVDEAIENIEKHSRKRSQSVPATNNYKKQNNGSTVEVTVGGATVFVVDVERFEKL
jgi:uncharacterized protein YaaQ